MLKRARASIVCVPHDGNALRLVEATEVRRESQLDHDLTGAEGPGPDGEALVTDASKHWAIAQPDEFALHQPEQLLAGDPAGKSSSAPEQKICPCCLKISLSFGNVPGVGTMEVLTQESKPVEAVVELERRKLRLLRRKLFVSGVVDVAGIKGSIVASLFLV
eukprot:scaffold1583_cov299-Pinguiococcus_pyrenoidosus.AAC.20